MQYKEVYTQKGTHAADIVANYDWASALRIRMSDIDWDAYKYCNFLRVVNNADEDIEICYTLDIGRTDSVHVKAKSSFIIEPIDGIRFMGVDIYNRHATTDITAGDVTWRMAKLKEIPEQKVVNEVGL